MVRPDESHQFQDRAVAADLAHVLRRHHARIAGRFLKDVKARLEAAQFEV